MARTVYALLLPLGGRCQAAVQCFTQGEKQTLDRGRCTREE